MADRPILFSGPMIRALLDGSKTQTRRVVKLPHLNPLGQWEPVPWGGPNGGRTAAGELMPAQVLIGHSRTGDILGSPYGQPGDRLWVRESHWFFQDEHDPVTGYTPPVLTAEDVEYRADGESTRHGWRPSIHMPRWASRITLEITGVRVERLQMIGEVDATAEGVERIDTEFGMRLRTPHWRAYGNEDTQYAINAVGSFRSLWTSINGADSWDANPWVWVVEFKRATQEPPP